VQAQPLNTLRRSRLKIPPNNGLGNLSRLRRAVQCHFVTFGTGKNLKRQKDHSVRRAGRCYEHWLDAIAIWEKALRSLDLRKVVDDYIGIGRVPREKVLVIALSREEGSARLYDGDDRGVECMRIVELGDVGLRNSSLLSRCREDRRTILGTGVRPLPVEFGRIMGDREIDLQEAAIGDLPWIEGDLDGFRMRGRARAYRFVLRRLLSASGITGHGIAHAPDVLIDALHAPKTPAGKDGDLECPSRGSSSAGAGIARPSLAADGNALSPMPVSASNAMMRRTGREYPMTHVEVEFSSDEDICSSYVSRR
jgi:hypothetical protein